VSRKIGSSFWSTFILIFLVSISLAISGFAQEIKISATVDRNPVALNEQFRLEVEVSGPVQNLPDANLPDLSQFAILSGPNVSSSFQIINFSMTASRTYTVILLPKEVGNFQIQPATVKYKDEEIKSNSINLTVTKQTSQAQPPPASTSPGRTDPSTVDLSKTVFIRAIPSKKRVYQNEEVTIQYKLYFRQRITNNEMVKLPEAVGCWVEEYPISQRPSVFSETLNGIQYNVAEIRKVAVFPSRPGKITVSPMILKVETLVPRRRSRDLFDEFFADPFGQTVTTPLNSGAIELTVLPLPEKGKPENFTGLVGSFNLKSSLDKNEIKTNEAVSLKINISGRGILKILNSLPVEFSPNFEVYEPKISESVNKSGDFITSTKEFEYVIIPRVAGEQKITEFTIPYFDPVAKKYEFLKVPEHQLEVFPGTDLSLGIGSGSVLSKEEVRLLGKDIRFIKEIVPKFHPVGKMPYHNWWFYFSFIFPVLVLGIAWGYQSHLEKMSTNIQYARSRRAQQQARNKLKLANSYLKQVKTKEFYGEISNALIGFIADKTNRASAGLLREEIIEIFNNYQVDERLKREFLNCLDQADFNRFAPGSKTSEDMVAFYKEAEKILVLLGKYL
jgi:hypothetical protein